jgi:hypothetical protein
MYRGSSNTHSGSFQYTSILAHTYYVVYLKGILFGGKVLQGITAANYNGGKTGGTIVDSGSTLLLMSPMPYAALRDEFYAFCAANPSLPCGAPGQIFSQSLLSLSLSLSLSYFLGLLIPFFLSGNGLFDFQCAQLTTDQLNSFPSMTFQFGSSSTISVTVPGRGYFIPCNQNGFYTVGIDAILPEGNAILGDVFMQNFEVLFDVGNNRVGFAPVKNCVYTGTSGGVSVCLFILPPSLSPPIYMFVCVRVRVRVELTVIQHSNFFNRFFFF